MCIYDWLFTTIEQTAENSSIHNNTAFPCMSLYFATKTKRLLVCTTLSRDSCKVCHQGIYLINLPLGRELLLHINDSLHILFPIIVCITKYLFSSICNIVTLNNVLCLAGSNTFIFHNPISSNETC